MPKPLYKNFAFWLLVVCMAIMALLFFCAFRDMFKRVIERREQNEEKAEETDEMGLSIQLLRQKRQARSERARRMWENPRYRLRRGIADGMLRSFTDPEGYILRYSPSHSRARQNGYVLEHILVWEEAHAVPLKDGAIIHHINGIPSDNRPENLFATSQAEHSSYHYWRKKNEKDLSLESLIEFGSLCQYQGKMAAFLATLSP